MATKNLEELVAKKESPVLKKRTSPEEVTNDAQPTEKKSPLKKRSTPLDEMNPENSVATLMKKRELPGEDKESVTPLKKKTNPFDKKDEEPKEKSSLDKMRERIAAQKKLEQDMMTQQSLRNQEKVNMRNKLSALTKDLNEEAEEDVDIVIPTPKAKPIINSDLKTEALETQNKKLKSDLEKSKQQLQALLSLEYQNMKVLDSNNLSLSDEFIQNINNLKEQYEAQKNLEEQSLKEELNSLQKELVDLKNKNAAAKKASDEARKAAAQAEKAIEETKRVIEEQENDQIRNFKEEIKELEKQIKDKEKQISSVNNEKEKVIKEYDTKLEQLNKNNEELNNIINDLKQNIASLEKQKSENNELININNELKAKLDQLEKDYQVQLKEQLDKSFEKVSQLEKDADEMNDKLSNKDNEINQLKGQLNKSTDAVAKFEKDLIDSKEQLSNKDKEIIQLKAKISSLPTQEQVNDLQSKVDKLETSSKEKEELQTKYNNLLTEKEQISNNEQALQQQLLQLQEQISVLTKQQEEQTKEADSEKAKEISRQIELIELKIKENNNIISELREQYDRFIYCKDKLINDFAAVRKYTSLIVESELANKNAKIVAEEVSVMNPKVDKKAYKAKLAESKSMNQKALYLTKQIKNLLRNKQVSEYVKLMNKINEFDNQFKEINSRNNELELKIFDLKKEIK